MILVPDFATHHVYLLICLVTLKKPQQIDLYHMLSINSPTVRTNYNIITYE